MWGGIIGLIIQLISGAVGVLSGKQDEKSTSIRMRKCRRIRDEGRA